MSTLRFIDAIRNALDIELRRDPSVVVLGEDVSYGGPFGATKGLAEAHGRRIQDTPISEATVMGLTVGAALSGLRPVMEVMYIDFITLAMDQLVNHGAKLRYMTDGLLRAPMVIRAQGGARGSMGAHHSQSLEAWFAHVPGLKVVMPATAADAKGLLLSAIDDPNPVIVLEHKLLYRESGPVPTEAVRVPIGKAAVHRAGRDVTIVATGVEVSRSLAAAEQLAQEGIEASVIDPRTLTPLDDAPIHEDVSRTGRLLLVQEAPGHGGFTGEIAARIAGSDTLYRLLAPIKRLSGLDVPIPYAPQLEKACVPQVPDIVDAARTLVKES